MNMIYGERYGNQDEGEEYIAEKGIFLSMEEFLPYRAKGWSSCPENDKEADRLIAEIRQDEEICALAQEILNHTGGLQSELEWLEGELRDLVKSAIAKATGKAA